MDDCLGWFLECAGRTVLLTADEEIFLGKRVQAWQPLKDRLRHELTKEEKKIVYHGRRAKKRFFEGNIRLVIKVAKKYVPRVRTLDLSDLINEGSIGLNRAIEKFDPTRGYKFSTYAYWWIRQAVERAIAISERTIRLPMHGNVAILKLKMWFPVFIEPHQTHPTCLLYTSPSPRDRQKSRMPSSA